jgi:hypothetical protein
MEHANTISALVRLHGQLGAKIKANKKEANRLRADMLHVEAVLHMFDPTFNARSIAQRRQTHPNPRFDRGEMWPGALAVLKAAPAPMTATEIAKAMLRAKGNETPTFAEVRALYGTINPSLRTHAGKIVERVEGTHPKRWRMID